MDIIQRIRDTRDSLITKKEKREYKKPEVPLKDYIDSLKTIKNTSKKWVIISNKITNILK